MGYNWQQIIMIKKILLCCLFALPFFGFGGESFAQNRTKIIDGVYLVRYGNVAVVEDDINQKTWRLSVNAEEKKDSQGRPTGELIYELACGNKYTKGLTKFALSGAITTSLTAVAGPYGTVTAQVANMIASTFYDDVCEYYKKRYGKD